VSSDRPPVKEDDVGAGAEGREEEVEDVEISASGMSEREVVECVGEESGGRRAEERGDLPARSREGERAYDGEGGLRTDEESSNSPCFGRST
jgi:hypothetical protein